MFSLFSSISSTRSSLYRNWIILYYGLCTSNAVPRVSWSSNLCFVTWVPSTPACWLHPGFSVVPWLDSSLFSGSPENFSEFPSDCPLNCSLPLVVARVVSDELRIWVVGRWWWTRTRPFLRNPMVFVFWVVGVCIGWFYYTACLGVEIALDWLSEVAGPVAGSLIGIVLTYPLPSSGSVWFWHW